MPTRTVYRQALYKLLGAFESGTASGTGNNTTGQLECTDWPFYDSVLDSGYWTDKYLYRPNAVASGDKVRLVSAATPSSGLFTPSKPWTNAPTSEAFEMIGGPIDPNVAHECINDALKHCYVVDEFTFTAASATAKRHSMSTVTWLVEPSWVLRVGVLVPSDVRADVNPYLRTVRGEATIDDGVIYLETQRAFNTTDVVYVTALRPAYTNCKATAGSYGGLTSGLTAETDEAPVVTEWLVQAALIEVYDRLLRVAQDRDRQMLAQQRAEAAARFTHLRHAYLKPPPKTFIKIEWMGPTLGHGSRRSRMW